MANIIVVAALTVFRAEGKADLGAKDLMTFTIGDVKDEVSQIYSDLEVERLQIWWKGYLLDNNSQKVVDACVGVNGEILESLEDTLVLFLTVKSNEVDDDILKNGNGRLRTNSFDVEKIRNEIRRQKQKIESCIIM